MKTVTVYQYNHVLPTEYRGETLGHSLTDGFLEVTGENWAHLIPVVDIRKIEVSITEE